jgi:hypothetical protein
VLVGSEEDVASPIPANKRKSHSERPCVARRVWRKEGAAMVGFQCEVCSSLSL